MHIAIVDSVGSPYDGSTPYKRALGGSESAVVYIAKELVKIGIDVTVYNDCTNLDAEPGLYDGVTYRHLSSIPYRSEAYSLVISSRSVFPLMRGTEHWLHANKYVVWLHDTFCEGDDMLEGMVVRGEIDEIWTLSDWHTSYVTNATHGHRRMMEVLKRKIWVTRNGANFWGTPDFDKKDRDLFVFNASVTKGMEVLLDKVWPQIREQIPDARLKVIGGAYKLKENDRQNNRLQELMDKHDHENGVWFTGLITQEEVFHVVSKAGFMLYPQYLPETYGISTVESQLAGTPLITGRFGAMEETATEAGCYLMDYPVCSNTLYQFNDEWHIREFVEMAVKAHADEYLWKQKCQACLRVKEVCGWDKVALQWKQHVFKITGEYLTAEDYRKVQRINHRTHEIFNKRWSNPEEWAYYPEDEFQLRIVVPFYNASQYLSRCIESIKAQNYENFRVYLIDDASTEPLPELDLDWRWMLIRNEERVGALANQMTVVNREHPYPGDESIVVLIDGDDALTNDPNIFKKINALYHEGARMTYGSCRSMADGIDLIAQDYPGYVHKMGDYKRYKFAWNTPYTHLRTFKHRMALDIDDTALRDADGLYYKAGGDIALFYELIRQCKFGTGVRVVREVMYLYNDLNPLNDYKVNSEEQTRNANEICNPTKATSKASSDRDPDSE